MSRQVYIGIDVGTTVLKAAAYARSSGRMLGCSSSRLNMTVDAKGAREQKPAQLWSAVRRAVRDVVGQLNARDRVSGLGLAAQGGSAVVVDRDGGRTHTPMFLWNDMRFLPFLSRITRGRSVQSWRRLAWRDEPGWGLARMLWLKQTYPDLLGPGRMYVGAGELIYHRLTGKWQQDACNAHQIGCYDVQHHRLAAAPLKRVGVSIDQVAALRQGDGASTLTAAAAKELGIPSGIEVVGPYMDHEAGFMAASHLSRCPLQCSLGTAWVGNYRMPRDSKWSSPFQFVIPSPVNHDWLVIQPLLTGNVTWDWALSQLVHPQQQRALSMANDIFQAAHLPPEGLLALPWFNMPNVIWPQQLGSGVFFGLNLTTHRADLLRAIALAMVCELHRGFEAVVSRGVIDAIVLSGGASKAAVFQQLIGAMFEPLPVQVLNDQEWSGTRGVLRPFGSRISRAAARIVRVKRQKLADTIRHRADQYQQLYDRLYADVPAGSPIRMESKGAEA